MSLLRIFIARKLRVEEPGYGVRHRRRRVRVAAVAIDEARHRLRLSSAERDDERAAVVDEVRFELAVPDDDGPRALAHRSRVGQIPAHAGDDRLGPLGEGEWNKTGADAAKGGLIDMPGTRLLLS
jgi:hypothetical protein